jgi:hypothetical protein
LPDPKLFLWDIESDNLQYFNLASGKLDIHDVEDTELPPADQEQLAASSTVEQSVVLQTPRYCLCRTIVSIVQALTVV